MITLEERIQTELIGSKYMGVSTTCEILANIVGKSCWCCDSKIDDGADNDETEDSYVMKDCYEFEDSDIMVNIYYGDVSREIGYVEVNEIEW